MPAIVAPLPQFFDKDRSPLQGGSIYIGAANLNPETNPVSVYWDAAYTQPAQQPLRTAGGVIVRNGTAAQAYVSGDYSMLVKNASGEQVVYARTSTEFSVGQQVANLASEDVSEGDALLIVKHPATGGARRTQHEKNQDFLAVADFDPTANGTDADNTALTNAATAAGLGYAHIGAGLYGLNPYVQPRMTFQGAGHTSTLVSGSGTEFRKLANGLLWDMTQPDACLRDVTLNGRRSTGLTGGGLRLANERQRADDVAVFGAEGVGIAIGTGTATNCNIFQLLRPIVLDCGSHGIEVNSSAPDANAGLIVGADIRSNLGDGVRGTQSIDNVGIGWTIQSNAGRGVLLKAGTEGWKVWGLYTEANSPAPSDLVELEIELGSISHLLYGSRSGVTPNWKDRNPPGKNIMVTWEPGLDGGRWVHRAEMAIYNPADEAAPSTETRLRTFFGSAGVNVYDLAGMPSGVAGSKAVLRTLDNGGVQRDTIVADLGGATVALPNAVGTLLVGKTAMGTATGIEIGDGGGRINMIQTTAGARTFVTFRDASGATGSISTSGAGLTSYNTSSDYRLKSNFTLMDGAAALALLAQIRVGNFTWAGNGAPGTGVLAHELQAVKPEAVHGVKDATEEVELRNEEGEVIGTETRPLMQGVDYSKLVPELIAGLNFLAAEFAAYKATHP